MSFAFSMRNIFTNSYHYRCFSWVDSEPGRGIETPEDLERKGKVAPLVDVIKAGDPELKRGAIFSIAKLKPQAAVKILREALRDFDPESQFFIAGQLSRMAVTFFLTNAAFTWMSFERPALFGWGYLASTLVTLLLSVAVLWNRIQQLEFLTFVHQPISGHQKITQR